MKLQSVNFEKLFNTKYKYIMSKLTQKYSERVKLFI